VSSPPGFTLPFNVAVLVVTLVARLVDAVGATVAVANLAAFVNVLAELPAEPPVLEPVVVELLELVVAPVAEVDEPLVELPVELLPELALDVPGAGQLRS
jgi:hypothetical protein